METRGKDEVVQEADESVVVINPWPMKAGNSEEEKTGGTLRESRNEVQVSKRACTCEGRKMNQSMHVPDGTNKRK